MLAISMDSEATLRKWRDELKAPQRFVADPDGKVVKAYDAKMPVLSMATRATFVVGVGRKILAVYQGGDAVDAAKSVAACKLGK